MNNTILNKRTGTLTPRDRIIPCVMAAGMVTLFSWLSSGYSLIVTFVPAVPVALWLYFKTCLRDQLPVRKALPLYLLGIGFQLVHFAEEYVFRFDARFGPLFGGEPYNRDLFVCFNMTAYLLFLLGGIGFLLGLRPLLFFAMFFIVYGMLANGIWHFIYCLMAGGYFPGVYTGMLNLVLAPFLLRVLWRPADRLVLVAKRKG